MIGVNSRRFSGRPTMEADHATARRFAFAACPRPAFVAPETLSSTGHRQRIPPARVAAPPIQPTDFIEPPIGKIVRFSKVSSPSFTCKQRGSSAIFTFATRMAVKGFEPLKHLEESYHRRDTNTHDKCKLNLHKPIN